MHPTLSLFHHFVPPTTSIFALQKREEKGEEACVRYALVGAYYIIPLKFGLIMVSLVLFQKEVGVLLTPPTGKERAENWAGLGTERQLRLRFDDIER